MSTAPIRSLRTFWALGGAPAAFVRRDERLRLACDGLLRTATAGAALNVDRSFATLVATVDLSQLRPRAVDEPPVSHETPLVGPGTMPNARVVAPDAAGPIAHFPGDARAVRPPAGAAAVQAPESGRPRPTVTATTATREARQSPSSQSSSPVARRTVDEDAEAASDPRRTPRRAGASLELPDTAWRLVSPMRREADRDVMAGVARLLASDVPAPGMGPLTTPLPRARRAGGASAPEPATAASPGSSIAEQLDRVVRRVEQRDADASRSSRAGWPDSRAVQTRAARSWRADTSRPADAADDAPPRDVNADRGVGLRDLADRAPFFGMPRRESDGLWPDTELDRLSSLIEDAARQDGVMPEDALG